MRNALLSAAAIWLLRPGAAAEVPGQKLFPGPAVFNASSALRPTKGEGPDDRQLWLREIPGPAAVARLGHFGGIIPLLYQLRVRAPVTFNSSDPKRHIIRFQGRLRIELIATEMINRIYLNSKGLDIDTSQIRLRPLGTESWEPVQETILSEFDEIMIIKLRENLRQHRLYEILIPQFSGEVKPGFHLGVFHGFVHQTPTRYYYVTATQFQLSAARTAFPCVDSPFFKANLSLTVSHPPHSVALGNMESIATRQRTTGWKETRMATSPRLPTYTMGFVVLPDLFRTADARTRAGLRLQLHYNPFRVTADLAKELLRYARYSVDALTRYFQYTLPLEKIDFILLPEFVVQGMENFGMITLSQDYLLKQKPAYRLSLIAHELAHQWFSNIATVRGWSEICFQEGITDHFARVVVSSYFGAGEDWDDYIVEKYITGMMQETKNSPPESLILPPSPDLAVVSRRCFGKGVFVMNGLAQLAGSEAFRARVASFLSRFAHKLYSIDDFLGLFDDIRVDGDKPVSDYVKYWFRTGGFPSLFVSRDYVGRTVSLRQEQLFLKGPSFRTMPNVWPIPLKATLKSSAWHSPLRLLNSSAASQALPADSSSWVLVNPEFAFFYRVNYDLQNWALLTAALEADAAAFAPLSRAQLLYDFCFFHRIGLLPGAEGLRNRVLAVAATQAKAASRLRPHFRFLLSLCAQPPPSS